MTFWGGDKHVYIVEQDWSPSLCFNTLRPRQNGRHFADDIFKCIFLNENVSVSIKNSLKFAPKGPINNISPLVQIMAWRRPGDKPLSEPMMVRLPTQICVILPQWVNNPKEELWCWDSPVTVWGLWLQTAGPWFNIKMSSYQYRKSHYGDKTVFWPSYLHNGISYCNPIQMIKTAYMSLRMCRR